MTQAASQNSAQDSARDGAAEAQAAAAIARCAAGDRAALRVIYDIEAARMVGVARRMLRRQDLAEEAVQDAFMRVWRSARSFDPQKGAARSWLYAILRNCVLSILRDEGRFTADEEIGEEAGPMTESALARLPEPGRRCGAAWSGSTASGGGPWWCCPTCTGCRTPSSPASSACHSGTVKSWVRRSLISFQECMG